MAADLSVRRADYADPADAAAIVMLLDAYASDPAGGGEPLSDFAKANLVRELALRGRRPSASWLLMVTSAGRAGQLHRRFFHLQVPPLVNVHDVAVLASHRGRGIAEQMLALAETIARERGAVKMTLEVLVGQRAGGQALHPHRLRGLPAGSGDGHGPVLPEMAVN